MVGKEKNWQETKSVIISAFILGFVFGFNDKSDAFVASFWLRNYIQQTILALLFILLFVSLTKSYSAKQGVTTNFSLWSMKRIGLTKSAILKGNGFPLGIILPLFISIMGYGKILFASILTPNFAHSASSRFGKKFLNPKESELASISLIGPLALMLLGIFLSSVKDLGLNNISVIPFAIAICSMLPLPGLNGVRVLTGSPVRYVLVISFMLITFLLTYYLTPLQSLILGIVAGIIITFFHYIYSYILK